jgi:hypothetical protein
MKVRKLLLVAGAALLPSVLLLVVQPGLASASVVAVGTANCNIASGGGTINPKLTAAGSNGGMKINFSAKLGPCPNASFTTPSGDTIVAASMTGKGYYSNNHANKCASYFGSTDTIGRIKVTIKWKATPTPIANTVLKYVAVPSSGAPAAVITLQAPPAPVASGSFEPASPVPPMNTITLNSNLTCGGPHNFAISGGNVDV